MIKNAQKGNWRRFEQIKTSFTYILQCWVYKDKTVETIAKQDIYRDYFINLFIIVCFLDFHAYIIILLNSFN